MKKLLSLLLSFMLLFSIASCGVSGGDTEGDGGGVTDGENSGAGDVNGRDETEPREIVIEVSESTEFGNLCGSTTGKLTAGIEGGSDSIDRAVAERNEAAAKAAGVTVRYKYLPDQNNDYYAGLSVQRIRSETLLHGSGSTDIYYNFTRDMVELTLFKAFSNLKEDTSAEEVLFRFNSKDYGGVGKHFGEGSEEGYYYGYMNSVSLAEDKLYTVASDYGLDFARSFLAIPTSVSLLSDASKKLSENSGVDAIEEITGLVKAGKWTFSALARYANAAYVEKAEENSASATDRGEVLGFAISANYTHLNTAYALFSSSGTVSLRNRDTGPYYTDESDKAVEILSAISSLVGERGVNVISIHNVSGQVEQVLREEFKSRRVLFGGVCNLSALEGGAASVDGGLLILPPPIYKEAEGISYNTVVTQKAKVFAIAAKTDAYRECAVFLDYQSTHSEDIGKGYLHSALGIDTGDDIGKAGRDMLDIIISSVRDSLDTVYANFTMHSIMIDMEDSSWYGYIMANGYLAPDVYEQHKIIQEHQKVMLEYHKSFWAYLE